VHICSYELGEPIFDLSYPSSTETSPIIVTISGEGDRSSSIEQLFFVSAGDNQRLTNVNKYNEIHFENLSLYSEPFSDSDMNSSVNLYSDDTSIYYGGAAFFRNCLVHTNNSQTFSYLSARSILANVSQTTSSRLESWNTNWILQDASSSGGVFPRISSHIVAYSLANAPTGAFAKLYNSKFVNTSLLSFDPNNTDYYAVYVTQDSTDASYFLVIDNCIFWRGVYDPAIEYLDSIRNGDGTACLSINSDTVLAYVSYGSRSIHNYANGTYDAPQGAWIEMTGEAESLASLGSAGYGLLEQYSQVVLPFSSRVT